MNSQIIRLLFRIVVPAIPPFIILTILLPGCFNDNGISAPHINALTLSAENTLVYRMDISLDRTSDVIVRYSSERTGLLEIVSEEPSVSHSLLLTRLVAGTAYMYRVEAGEAVMEGEFTTEPLPDDLAMVEFTTSGEPTLPLALVKIFQPGGFNGYVVIDAAGNIVWYYRTEGRSSGAARRSNGNFVFIDSDVGLVEVDVTGSIVSLLPQEPAGREIHHDVVSLESGEILFLARDPQTVDGVVIAGEAVWEWIPEKNQTRKLWSSFDHLSPVDDWAERSVHTDWLHANSVSVGPGGNVLISLHFLNQVISIAPDFQSLQWRLGGLNAAITVDENEKFSGQHTAAETSPGQILIFDNGFEREEPYSRAVEFRIEGDRAEKVWEFRPPRDNWSRIISSARRLDNGNTYVTFGVSGGLAGSTGPIEAYEVTPGGEILWHMEASGSVSSVYRATPFPMLSGERLVPGWILTGKSPRS